MKIYINYGIQIIIQCILVSFLTTTRHLTVRVPTIKAGVTVKNEYGEVVAEEDVPATNNGVYEVTTPENEGGVVEVSDNN